MGKAFNVLIAAAAGFAAGILLAPKSGEATRQELKQRARQAEKAARRKAGVAREKMREGADTLHHGVDVASVEAAEFGHSAKETAEKIAAEAAALGGEARIRTRRVVNDTRQTMREAAKPVAKDKPLK